MISLLYIILFMLVIGGVGYVVSRKQSTSPVQSLPTPPECTLSEYVDVTTCSCETRPETKTQRRQVLSGKCNQPLEQTVACDYSNCLCVLTDWSECSASCGGGVQTRDRVSGSNCPDQYSSSRIRICNTDACAPPPPPTASPPPPPTASPPPPPTASPPPPPTACVVSDWSNWSPECTGCDDQGNRLVAAQTRSRTVLNESARTEPCPALTESKACPEYPCPCVLKNWSACSAPCNGGVQTRDVQSGVCLSPYDPSRIQVCGTTPCSAGRSCTLGSTRVFSTWTLNGRNITGYFTGFVWNPARTQFIFPGCTSNSLPVLVSGTNGTNGADSVALRPPPDVNPLQVLVATWSPLGFLIWTNGDVGAYFTSADGVNWVTRPKLSNVYSGECASWSPELGLVVVGVQNQLHFSADGLTWLPGTLNGQQWSASTLVPKIDFQPYYWDTLVYSAPLRRFVAHCTGNLTTATSVDGVNWFTVNAPFAVPIRHLIWCKEKGRFFALTGVLGDTLTRRDVYASANGIDWILDSSWPVENTWDAIGYARELDSYFALRRNEVLLWKTGQTPSRLTAPINRTFHFLEWAPEGNQFILGDFKYGSVVLLSCA